MGGSSVGDPELAPGLIVGEYQLGALLGEGGMGQVYAAKHPLIGKPAAVKILREAVSRNPEAVERFLIEARAVNQIGHPNIVDIFSFGTLPDGRQYYVMEHLRGETLRDRVERGPLPIAEAIAITETITLPLEAAHDKGIVHRDLKPDNVFLVEVKESAPVVKLLDFGIAKLIGDDSVRRTQTGSMLGTPAYISPEQARGQNVDHRTDIYALGAMLFELVTGEMVFQATTAAEMIAMHLYVPPREPSSLVRSLPPALDALVARMLAKDAADRPSLAEVRSSLRALRAQLDLQTPPHGVPVLTALPTPSGSRSPAVSAFGETYLSAPAPAPKRTSRVPMIVGALLFACVAFGIGLYVARRPSGGGSRVESHGSAPDTAVPRSPLDAGDATVLPDAGVLTSTDAGAAAPVDAGAPRDAGSGERRNRVRPDAGRPRPAQPADDDDAPM